MQNEITENLREVRSSLENVMVKRKFLELPDDVKERVYKASGNLSRAIALMTFKYEETVKNQSINNEEKK